jgi:hypothetical protein
MTDPRRLLSDPHGGLEAALLRAGAEEEPSRRAVERTVAAVGAGAATLGIVGAAASAPVVAGAAAASSLGAVGAVKLLAMGAVAGLASGGALFGVSRVVNERPEKPVPVVAPAETAVAPPLPAPPPPVVTVEAPPVVEPPVSAAPAPRPAPASTEPEGTPLATEVALVDRAHAALRRGDASEALAILAAYESAFASPRLLPEVFALRMEASERAGDAGAARQWASRLVTRYPRSAQAARAYAVLGSVPAEDR